MNINVGIVQWHGMMLQEFKQAIQEAELKRLNNISAND